MNFGTQDDADRITRIRAWAEVLMRGDSADTPLVWEMEALIRQTGYWRAYQKETYNATVAKRGQVALRVVPKWESHDPRSI